MDCNFSWTLELLAAVAYAKSLWEKRSVKIKVFEACDPRWSVSDPATFRKNELNAITEELVSEICYNNLPETIGTYVIHIIRSMGKKISSWAEHLEERFNLKIRNADAIYWTSIGTIDQSKIFQNCVSDLLNHEPYTALYFASSCAELNFFKIHCEDIKKFLNDRQDSLFLMKYQLIAATFLHVNEYLEALEGKTSWCIDKDKSEAANLFILAIVHGCDFAVKHYWTKMSSIDQEEEVVPGAVQCLEVHATACSNFMGEQYVEILLFLISKMSEYQAKDFILSRKCDILYLLLSVWPAQEFFLPLLKKIKQFFSYSDYVEVLSGMVILLRKENKWKSNPYPSFFYNVFKVVWHSFTKDFKNEIVSETQHVLSWDYTVLNFTKILSELFDIFFLPSLKLIINDKNLVPKRNELINIGKEKFRTLVTEEKFEILDAFVQEVLMTDEERDDFRFKLNFYDSLIDENRFECAEKFLIWQLNGRNDRIEFIMKQINCAEKCQKLIENGDLSLAEKLVNWVLKSDADKKNFTNIFKNDDFLREKIFTIWIRKGQTMKDKKKEISQFMKLFLETKSGILNFKRERLIMNEKSIVTFFKNLSLNCTYNYKLFEKFLNFYKIPSNKIAEVKKGLYDNFETLFSDNNLWDFSDVEYLLNWCTENGDEKKAGIEKLFNGVDFVSLLSKIKFRNDSDKIKFYNEWIKDFGNFAKLKNETLSKLETSPLYSRNKYSNMEKILNKLERGEVVDLIDIHNYDYDYDSNSNSEYGFHSSSESEFDSDGEYNEPFFGSDNRCCIS